MRAAHFDLSAVQSMSVADNAALSMGAGVFPTFAFWIRPEVTATFQYFLSKGAGSAGTREYQFNMSGSNLLQWVVSDGATQATVNTAALTMSEWSFIVAQYDGANIQLSVNNGAFATVARIVDIRDSTAAFSLGARSDLITSPFTGALDSLGIWKRVLSAAELAQVYNGGVGLAYRDLAGSLLTSLTAWWDLDDAGGSAATWVDKAGTNHLTAGTGTAAPTSTAGKR